MNIQELRQRIKPSEGSRLLNKLFLSLVIILASTLSFGLGRLSVVGNREPVKIEMDPSLLDTSNSVPNTASVIQALPVGTDGVVASRKGTKYHYSYCPGAKQISEANKITFSSAKEAESAGYTLAANCKPR
jgi:hypothetical protein